MMVETWTTTARAGLLAMAPLAAASLLAACDADRGPALVRVGEPAPAFAAPTLTGDTVALADLRGDAVVLNVWATWCPPCREEMPGLEALHREYADQGLRVVGVSIDGRGAAVEVREFLDRNGITFTILHDPEERVTRTFRAVGVPETYLIDRDGLLVQRWIGKIDPQSEPVQAAVREALAPDGRRG